MTNGIDTGTAKWLTYLVYFLLAILTLVTAWSKVESAQNAQKILDMERSMPDKFVRLERYTSDKSTLQCSINDLLIIINKVDQKIDRAIERQIP